MFKTLERLQQARETRNNEKGFTLIELLIVIVILGVLAGIVVFAVQGVTDDGTNASCKAEYKTVETALEAYYASSSPKAYPADGNFAPLVPKFLHSTPTNSTFARNASGAEVVSGAGKCAGVANA